MKQIKDYIKVIPEIIGKLSEFAYRKPFIIWVTLVVIIISSVYLIKNFLSVDNSNEAVFLQNDPAIAKYKEFQNDFGSDEFVFILVDFNNHHFLKDTGSIKLLNEISRNFEEIIYKKENLVDEVISIINADYIEAKGDFLKINKFINIRDLPDSLDELERKALNEDSYINNLISDDGTKAGILVHTIRIENDGTFRRVIANYVNNLLEQYSNSNKHINLKAVGIPIIQPATDVITTKQFSLFFSLSILVTMIMLFVFYRKITWVIAPIMIVVICVAMILATMSALSVPLAMMSTIIPSLLIAVSVGDSIHVLHEYRKNYFIDPEQSFIKTIKSKIKPCFFTSITTATGFITLTTAEIRPIRELGIFSALGVFLTFVVTFLVLPLFLKNKKQKIKKLKVSHFQSRLLNNLSIKVYKYPKTIILISIGITLLAILTASKIDVETNFVNLFKKNIKVRQDYEYVDKTMGGSSSLDIVINSKEQDGIYNTKLFESIDQFQDKLEKNEFVFKSFSVIDIVKKMNQVLNENQLDYYSIPQNDDFLRQSLFLYEISKQDAFEGLIDEDFQKLHINIRLKNTTTKEYKKIEQEIDNTLSSLLPNFTEYYITGSVPLFIQMANYITSSQLKSFLLAFIIIAVMMIITTRSISLGLLSMYSNIVPILFMFGLMGLAKIPLDLVTVLTCSISIGVAVDNTIHIISRFKGCIDACLEVEEAVTQTIQTVGGAVFSSTIPLILGFMVMIFSDVTSISNFGVLAAFTILVALIADIFITPSILFLYYSRKIKRKNLQ